MISDGWHFAQSSTAPRGCCHTLHLHLISSELLTVFDLYLETTIPAQEKKMTHVVVCLASKIVSRDFKCCASVGEDLLLFVRPRDPHNLVFHLKFKLTAAPSTGSPRSDFVSGEKKTHSSIPGTDPERAKARTKLKPEGQGEPPSTQRHKLPEFTRFLKHF